MSTQISLKLSDKMFAKTKKYVEKKGYDSTQDFIRELIREKLFEDNLGAMATAIASEKVLAKTWNTKDEDKAWKHLQKEI